MLLRRASYLGQVSRAAARGNGAHARAGRTGSLALVSPLSRLRDGTWEKLSLSPVTLVRACVSVPTCKAEQGGHGKAGRFPGSPVMCEGTRIPTPSSDTELRALPRGELPQRLRRFEAAFESSRHGPLPSCLGASQAWLLPRRPQLRSHAPTGSRDV